MSRRRYSEPNSGSIWAAPIRSMACALWRGLLKSKSTASLAALRTIIVVKESNTGLGMQLRLVAGPLSDAATAAKICAALVESQRSCETAVFDGQRLAMKADEPSARMLYQIVSRCINIPNKTRHK